MGRKAVLAGVGSAFIVAVGGILWLQLTRPPCEANDIPSRPDRVVDGILGEDRNAGVFVESNPPALLVQVVDGASRNEANRLRAIGGRCPVRIEAARFTLAELDEYFDRLDRVHSQRAMHSIRLVLETKINRIVVESSDSIEQDDRAALEEVVPAGVIGFRPNSGIGSQELT